MAYTSSDLSEINTAIMDLAMGKRVTKITYSSGETVEYGPAGLGGLKQLKADILSEISSAANTPKYIRTISRKGL